MDEQPKLVGALEEEFKRVFAPEAKVELCDFCKADDKMSYTNGCPGCFKRAIGILRTAGIHL